MARYRQRLRDGIWVAHKHGDPAQERARAAMKEASKGDVKPHAGGLANETSASGQPASTGRLCDKLATDSLPREAKRHRLTATDQQRELAPD